MTVGLKQGTLAELADKYELSRLLIKGRMEEIRARIKETDDQQEKRRLTGRLSGLNALYRDVRAIALLLEHYYESGFYRDGRYCIQRDGAHERSRVSSIHKANRTDKRRADRPAQKEPDYGNRLRPDDTTAEDVVDVLFRGIQNGANW